LRATNRKKIDFCNSQIMKFIKEKNIKIIERN